MVLSRYHAPESYARIKRMKKLDPRQIAALAERLARLLVSEAHTEDLLPVQWEALRYLERANRFSRTAGALTSFLGLTKGTVSQTLKTLEARGFVHKQIDAKDRRRIRLALTAKGQKYLGKDPLLKTVAAVEALPSVTRQNLSTGLESLLSVRLAAQARQPFGQCRDCVYFANRHPQGNPHYCQLLNENLTTAEAYAICSEQQPKN